MVKWINGKIKCNGKIECGEWQMGSQITEVSLDTPGRVCQVLSCSPGFLENPSLEHWQSCWSGWILLSKSALLPLACSALKPAKALPGFPWEDQGHRMLQKHPQWNEDGFPHSLSHQRCELSVTGTQWPPPCSHPPPRSAGVFGSVQGTPGPSWAGAGSLLSACLTKRV